MEIELFKEAVNNDDLNTIKKLGKDKFDFNQIFIENGYERTPLVYLAIKKKWDILQYILNNFTKIIPRKKLSLLLTLTAQDNYDLDLVKFLVTNGADVNGYNWENNTNVFMNVCYDAKLDIAKYLYDNLADIRLTNNKGHNGLFMFCFGKSDSLPFLRFLLGIGLDYKQMDDRCNFFNDYFDEILKIRCGSIIDRLLYNDIDASEACDLLSEEIDRVTPQIVQEIKNDYNKLFPILNQAYPELLNFDIYFPKDRPEFLEICSDMHNVLMSNNYLEFSHMSVICLMQNWALDTLLDDYERLLQIANLSNESVFIHNFNKLLKQNKASCSNDRFSDYY